MGQAKTTAAQDPMAEAFGAKRNSAEREGATAAGRELGRKRSKRW